VLCGVLGVFVVLRGLSLLGDGLAHISFAGVALGLVLGIYPLGVALVAAVLGALIIHFLRERQVVRGDTAIGILFTAGLALGILLISSSRGLNVNVESYLFGSILGVQPRDVLVIAALGGALLLALGLLYKEFFYLAFSEEAARISGLPVHMLNVLFVSLTAASIVVAARVVGVLLVSALLVVPAASALQFARSFRGALALSVLFGVASAAAGLYASAEWGYATGASIALASTAFFAASVAARSAAARLGHAGA
jgi:zinc transport system permease protein